MSVLTESGMCLCYLSGIMVNSKTTNSDYWVIKFAILPKIKLVLIVFVLDLDYWLCTFILELTRFIVEHIFSLLYQIFIQIWHRIIPNFQRTRSFSIFRKAYWKAFCCSEKTLIRLYSSQGSSALTLPPFAISTQYLKCAISTENRRFLR